ncbi:MAG TPA: hypothetical protein VE463_12105, partial [Blastococcus sp.]|nr:hypothetical protein [Blastococcus sp.]
PRDTVAIDEPPAPPDDGGGIGGLFAGGEPEQPPVGKVIPPRTQAPPPPSAVQQPPPRQPEPPAAPPLYWSQNQEAEEPEERTGSRGRAALLALLGVLVVAALGIGAWLLLGNDDEAASTDAGTTAPPTQEAGPAVGDVQVVADSEYRLEAVQVDDTCAGHAYGDTATFFAQFDCTGLSRALYSTQIDGAAVVVAVARVQMPDTGAARELQALTDRNGSGNVSDLLREGVRYTGSPDALSGAEYASAVSGTAVTIVESAWVDENTEGAATLVDAAADAGLTLPVPPFA